MIIPKHVVAIAALTLAATAQAALAWVPPASFHHPAGHRRRSSSALEARRPGRGAEKDTNAPEASRRSGTSTSPVSSPPSPSPPPSLLDELPLDITDSSLFTGRWTIKSSNELITDDVTGFVTVEIDEGSFKAVGQRSSFLSVSKVERNGSFELLRTEAEEEKPAAKEGAETASTGGITSSSGSSSGGGSGNEDKTLVGELEFHVDAHVLDSVAGLGLPKPLSPSHVRDLGRKKRKVSIRVIDLDTIMLLFPERKSFYLMERTSPTPLDPNASATPINVLLVTNLVSLLVSGVVEALHHDAVEILHLIGK